MSRDQAQADLERRIEKANRLKELKAHPGWELYSKIWEEFKNDVFHEILNNTQAAEQVQLNAKVYNRFLELEDKIKYALDDGERAREELDKRVNESAREVRKAENPYR